MKTVRFAARKASASDHRPGERGERRRVDPTGRPFFVSPSIDESADNASIPNVLKGPSMNEDTPAIAVFADYENVALGARDAQLKFDVSLVLARLLDKGNVVVKRAYCDWERYKKDRTSLHEASFELIEIPHVSLSGKNSADIRMVVDALDLCHTKPHVGIFALLTGDSDFSPLVSKLRENNKVVIGIGVKNSTSDLLVTNCDEFVYYDELVRESQSKRRSGTRSRSVEQKGKTSLREEGIDMVVSTAERMLRDRSGNLWGSMVKQAIIRKHPNFLESYHGFRSFNQMLEAAAEEDLLSIEKDERGGGYLIVDLGSSA